MKQTFLKRLLVAVSVISILAQSLSPLAAILPQKSYAQEVTQDETSISPTPTDVPTPAPDQTSLTPTPTETPTPTGTTIVEPTPALTDTATPTPIPTDNLSPPADNSNNQSSNDNQNSSNDNQSSTQTPTSVSEVSPTVTPAPEPPTGNEELSMTILKNVAAPTIDLSAVVSEGSASLTTDKPDYAPTDTALITGSNLLPNTNYSLTISSTDNPATSKTVNVTSDDKGLFAYAYQLDGTYRPNYKAELKDATGVVVASTTFTDFAVVGPVFIDTNVNGVLDPGEQTFTTIQAAVNAATSGDTIHVTAGTYTEIGQIVINKNLSIVGADKTTTIIKPGQDTSGTGDAGSWILVNDGITFNLSKVTLDGVGRQIRQGIRFNGSGVVDDIIIQNIVQTGYMGFAIVQGYDNTTARSLSVTNSTFTNFGRVGIQTDNGTGGSTATISGNTFVGKGVGDHLDYAITVEGGSVATITNNIISDCLGVASSDGSTSAGIAVTTYFAGGTMATITGNTISNSTDGIGVGYDASDTSVVVAHNNNLSGNIEHGVNSTAPTVDATNNWWGNASGPKDNKTIPGSPNYNNPSGTGSPVTSYVDYRPWFTNSAMTTLSSANPVTEAATNPTLTGATLNGTNGDYDASNTSFWWGTSSTGPFSSCTNCGSQLPSGWTHDTGLGAESAGHSFSEALTGLTSGTPYYFVAWSLVSGTWYPGTVLTFTTVSPDTTAPATPLLVSPVDGVYRHTSNSNKSDWTDVTDPSSPVVYYYESSLSTTTNPDGSFTSIAYQSSALTVSEIMNPNEPEVTYYWHVKACDSVGNCSAWSSPWQIHIDNTAPSVPANGTPNNTTIATNNFNFDWDDSTDNSPITYKYQASQNPANSGGVLTNGLWTSGTLPTSMIHSSGAGDGIWYWQVKAVDAAGNESAWSPIWNVTLDTITPTVSVTSPSNGAYLKGTVTITADASDLGSGVSKVEFYHNSVPPMQLIGIDTTFPYSITWDTTSVADGSHGIYAKAYDAAGNNASSTTIPVIVDNTSPTVVSVDSDGKTFNIADMPSQTIKVTFNEDVANAPTIDVNPPAQNQTVNSCSDADAKTFCFDYTIQVNQEILHTIFVTNAQDAAGNTMDENHDHRFNIDTVAPTITSVTTTTANGAYTTGQIIDFEVSFNEAVNVIGGIPEFLVSAGPGRKAVYSSGSGTNTLTFNYTVGAADGTPTYLSQIDGSINLNGATIKDIVGNDAVLALPSSSAFLAAHSIVIDTHAPTITSVDSDGKIFNIADMPSKIIKVTFSEDIANTPTIGINPTPIDYQSVNNCGDVDAKTFCFDYVIPAVTETTHRIYVSNAQDLAGNTMASDNSHTFEVDTIAPSLSSQTTYSGWYTSNQTSTFTYADAGSGIVSGTPVTCTIATQGTNRTCSVTPSVCDAAGNCNTTPVTSNGANIDKTNPANSWINPLNNAFISGAVNLQVNATDAHSGMNFVRFRYQPSGGSFATIIDDTSSPYSTDWDTTGLNGSYVLRARAEDNSGRTNIKDITVNIDNISPAIPTATPGAGDYTSDQSVTLASSDGGSGLAGIYYTTDGSTPDETSTPYTTPIAVDHDMTIKAIAYDNVGNASDILTATYGIPPIISGEAFARASDNSLTLSWLTDDLSTSRVVYDTVSHAVLGSAPNYGYANSTVENPAKVTSHSVSITGLTTNATYYYRVISHGSPEAVGKEQTYTIHYIFGLPGDGKSDGGSTGVGAPSLATSVLGVSTTALAFAGGVGEEVLGIGTQPDVLGTSTNSATPTVSPTPAGQTLASNVMNGGLGYLLLFLVVLLIIAVIAYWLYRRKKNNT